MKWTRGWMIAAIVLVAAAVSVIAATLRQTRARVSDGQTTITWLCPMQLDRPLLERLVAQFGRAQRVAADEDRGHQASLPISERRTYCRMPPWRK